MLASFLALVVGLPDAMLTLAVSVPVWDQYTAFIRWALDSLATVLHSGGLAIIAFTIIVKTLLLPLTVQSTRSAKAMQELQPKIKELQKKHAKDRQRLTQETMALYQQHRVSPVAGCLPMLIQIPIFLGLYQSISTLSQGGGSVSEYWAGPFLWLSGGLNHPDPFKILPIIAGVFQFVQTRMMRPSNQGKITDPQQAMMNQVMNIMPLTVIAFGWGFVSGPVLYWATQSLYSVAQQWIITGWGSMRDWFPWLPELPEHRRLGYRSPEDLAKVTVVTGPDGKPLPPKGPMGWLQARMNDAQAQAAARADAPARSGTAAATVTETEQPAASPVRVTGGNRQRAKRGKGGVYKNAKAPGTNGDELAEAAPAAVSNGKNGAVIIHRKAKPVAEDA